MLQQSPSEVNSLLPTFALFGTIIPVTTTYKEQTAFMNDQFLITKIHRIIYVGKTEYAEPDTVFHNTLRHNELIFHLSGHATVYFNGKVLPTQADTVRFLPKGSCSQYRVERMEPGDCIDVFFDTDQPVSEEAFVQKINNNTLIGTLFKKMFATWVGKEQGYYFECLSLLYKVLAELQKDSYIPQKQYLTIKPAITYIDEHFLDGRIPIDSLAQHCGISISYLKKLFVKRFGVTPTKYVIQRRINYACDLLQTQPFGIAEIAAMCGYEDVSFFSRQFKEYVGIAPTVFAKKYKSSK